MEPRSRQEHPSLDFRFVQEAVRRCADLHPTKAALVDAAGRRVDYGELWRRTAGLASVLRGAGVRPDACVAVWMDRSVELIVAMLAILEAGGAYVPIDTAYPVPRMTAMLENVGATVLVTDRALPPELAALGLHVLRSDAAPAGGEATTDAGLDLEHVAYVMYTSGSTAAPKGVAMSHRGLTRLIRWQVASGPPGLSTLQFTPICFDVTFQEVFGTLCTGGTLFLVDNAVRRDPQRLLVDLEQRAIQRLFLPYVALQQLAKAAERSGRVPSSLKHVITAGERLIVTEAIARFFRALADCRLDNHYGPTEAHLVTSFTLTGDPAGWPTMPPIGAAVGDVTVHNLDGDLSPVPPGRTGELYVGGDGVARGYLGAPALTAERFIPDPFRPGGARMYKTGDLVRTSPGGAYEFAGRSDDQIKVRGYRIEPAEVELALTNHPAVRDATVGLRTVGDGVGVLVAYVVTGGAAVSVSELSRHARDSLPAYMIPSRFVFLESLPLTPSGKVDHVVLSDLELPEEPPAAQESASLAGLVRAIWERVLGHDEIGPEDDFFDVGGDSLLATWVVTELCQALGREVELSLLLQDSTLAGLVRSLEELPLDAVRAARPSEVITLRSGPSQRALFLVHPLGGEIVAYREVARSLEPSVRVLGLRFRAEEPGRGPALSLQEMAAIHLEQVRAIQPSGPYRLAGWSFGGVLAYEMAQQLRAAGARVDFLGLIDANPVLDPITGTATKDTSYVELLDGVLLELDRAGEAAGAHLAAILTNPYLLEILGNTLPEGVTAAHLRKNLQITRGSLQAAMSYRPAPYGGTIHLFQAASSTPALQASLAAELRALCASTRIHSVPGDHSGILRAPLAETLARSLNSALESPENYLLEHDSP